MALVLDTEKWVQQQFRSCPLGDVWRTRRLAIRAIRDYKDVGNTQGACLGLCTTSPDASAFGSRNRQAVFFPC